MENLIEFVGNNYAWFLTITILLLFALIGYIYDSKRSKNDLMAKNEEEINEIDLENLVVPEGKSLNEIIYNTKNVNPKTKSVELVDNTILNNSVGNMTPQDNLPNNVQDGTGNANGNIANNTDNMN